MRFQGIPRLFLPSVPLPLGTSSLEYCALCVTSNLFTEAFILVTRILLISTFSDFTAHGIHLPSSLKCTAGILTSSQITLKLPGQGHAPVAISLCNLKHEKIGGRKHFPSSTYLTIKSIGHNPIPFLGRHGTISHPWKASQAEGGEELATCRKT